VATDHVGSLGMGKEGGFLTTYWYWSLPTYTSIFPRKKEGSAVVQSALSGHKVY